MVCLGTLILKTEKRRLVPPGLSPLHVFPDVLHNCISLVAVEISKHTFVFVGETLTLTGEYIRKRGIVISKLEEISL